MPLGTPTSENSSENLILGNFATQTSNQAKAHAKEKIFPHKVDFIAPHLQLFDFEMVKWTQQLKEQTICNI